MTDKIGINWKALVKETLIRRKAKGLTQKAHADSLGISVPTLSKFECGETNLSLDIVLKILDSVGLLEKPTSSERAYFERFIETGNNVYKNLDGTTNAYFSMACQIHAPWEKNLPSFLETGGRNIIRFYPTTYRDFIPKELDKVDYLATFPNLNYFGLTPQTQHPLIYVANQYFEDLQATINPEQFIDSLLPLINLSQFIEYCVKLAGEYTHEYACKYSFSVTFNKLLGRVMRNQAYPLKGSVPDENYSGAATKDSVTFTLDIFPKESDDETIFKFALPLYQAFGYQDIPDVVKEGYATFLQRNNRSWMND